MCGIFGYISKSGELNMEPAKEVLRHRGPDANGTYLHTSAGGLTTGIGHVRLSIIDLDPRSNQPFESTDGRYVMAFNGEIYNYQSLRKELVELGVEFQTQGDTEVLFYWLQKFGTDRLNELEGMFAVSFLDKKEGMLLLIRDQLGIKPLYYTSTEDGLFYSSEIKALWTFPGVQKTLDRELIAEYLLNGFIYEPETGFEGVQKVFPGSYLTINTNSGEHSVTRYWTSNATPTNAPHDFQKLVDDSIQKHTISDVPVGLFFSGGIDSTVILVSVDESVRSMTVQSEESEYKDAGISSDYDYAMKIGKILNRDIESIPLAEDISTNEDFLKAVRTTASENEELMYDFTYISSKMLSFKARERNRIVVLSGMGADELFGGYPRYQLVKYKGFFKLIAPIVNLTLNRVSWFSKKIGRFNSFMKENHFGLAYSSLVGVFSKDEVGALLKDQSGIHRFSSKISSLLNEVDGASPLKKAMYLDRFGFLSHNFLVADKSSMQASIEMRVPLVTKSLAEAVWNTSEQKLVKGRVRKMPLVDILMKFIPKEIIFRKKAGFNPPLDGYVKKLGREGLKSEFHRGMLKEVADLALVDQWVEEHFNGEKNHTYRLYQLLHLSAWLDLNLSPSGAQQSA